MHRASCQCGALAVQSQDDPDFVIVCNCRACQKRTGAPFGTGAYFRRSGFAVTGKSTAWERKADSGRWIRSHFCPACGTTLWWELEMRPDHAGVAFGAFDTPHPRPIRVIWTEEQHDWVGFPAEWPHLEKGSPPS